jgi:hypothetical protein
MPTWLGPTSIEITETTIKTAKRKRLTLITRDRVTTLLLTSLVIIKTKIEVTMKMGMKILKHCSPREDIRDGLVLGYILLGDKLPF